ncbi:MAG: crotonase/enoyl-CoA hydratase family protein [Deltaproteobacteria bacterium]|nr:crotonase/enoyl-CoA hydratase family protein [Deltaproteobacteria bacterium]
MNDSKPIKVEKKGHIAWVIMNSPEKRNAMTFDFFMQMIEVFTDLDDDPGIRVAIIKGEGKSFTAGIDLASLAGLAQPTGADSRENLRRILLKGQQSNTAIIQCRKPVICAIHSHCIGGGVDLICACDIRLASKDAIFAVRETKLGVIADLGTIQRLPDIVGDPWARELIFTGRDFLAGEALNIGLITHMYETQEELYEAADKLANEIADNSPLTVMGAKDTMRFTRQNGIQASLEYVAQKNAAQLMCEDLMEAVTALTEKRKPVFKGR